MSDYYKLLAQKGDFLDVFNAQLSSAAQNKFLDNNSATNIQRVFRGLTDREIIRKKSFKVNEIQRVFRGHMGRVKANSQLKQKADDRELSLFNYLCIQIQRNFRGYYSRKYKQDQYRRKKYFNYVVEQGQKAIEEMEKYASQQAEMESTKAEEDRQQKFRNLAQDLHHLTSTRQIRGVYNPSPEFNEIPKMDEIPIEYHIRGAVRDLLKTKGISKTGLIEDLNGTKKIPLKGLKNRLSIQASAPYDTIKQAERSEKLRHKYAVGDKGNFIAGTNSKILEKSSLPPMNATGEPYLDQWANPLLVKGVPKDQKQLLESTRLQKPLFVSHVEKPFVSRTGGNKSAALPNDIFDVIAEAEETGGAHRRYLGTGTARFGLPASADNRTDGTVPKPPMRSSALVKSTRTKVRTFNLRLKSSSQTASMVTSLVTSPAKESIVEFENSAVSAPNGSRVHFEGMSEGLEAADYDDLSSSSDEDDGPIYLEATN